MQLYRLKALIIDTNIQNIDINIELQLLAHNQKEYQELDKNQKALKKIL